MPDAIQEIGKKLLQNSLIKRVEFEDNFLMLSNLLDRAEFLTFSEISFISRIFSSIFGMPKNSFYAVSEYFTESLLTGVGSLLQVIQSNYLFDGYQIYHEAEYEEKATSLQEQEYGLLSTLHYLAQISAKVTENTSTLTYETESSSFKIQRLKARDIEGNTIVLDGQKNITVEFDQDFFNGSEATSPDYVVKIISAVWKLSPLTLYAFSPEYSNSDTVSLIIVDESQNLISSTSKMFRLSMPRSKLNSAHTEV